MNYKLIADAGSSKTDWALLKENCGAVERFSTDGLNALLASVDDLQTAFKEVKSKLNTDYPVEEIYFYGAGCATPEVCNRTRHLLMDAFQAKDAMVTTDLLGAARSLLGNNRGIACILGTGSNSCLYDGMTITANVPSLGFILGDEGSGAALGKRLVTAAFKGDLPDIVKEEFLDTFHLTLADILDKVYRQPAPNKFLASLVPFLHKRLWNPYVYSLVLKELTRFMAINVAKYDGAHSLPVCFTGSIAFHFEKLLHEAAASRGFSVGKVSASPMDGLIEFHRF